MLHEIKKHLSTQLLVSFIIAGFFLVACEKDEDLSGTIQLEVFGPSPVLRGGEIKFIGKNLDKVTSVILPENMEISQITVVSSEEIRITIPQSAVPGYIILKHPQGEISTKTPLTFSEPIAIEKVSPLAVKAGDILTIEGEYLNLIAQVIFTKDIAVDSTDFVSRSRQKIEVTVPKEAQSGKISLSNGAEIPILIYSEEEIVVALPTVISISPNPVKPGETLTIKGTDFHLVESILFPDDLSVTEFVVNESSTEITVTVPELAKEGQVKLLAFSGVEIETEEVSMTAPTIKSLNPNPAKNGANLTIEGTHLDLVTSISFGGDVEGEIRSQSATSIVVTVPLTATAGNVVLKTHSGKTADAELDLVTPTITLLNPTTLMAGEALSITGTNLDLVKTIVFGGDQRVEDITATSPTSLRVNVPTAATSGTVTLLTVNGTEITSSNELTVTSPNIPIITNMPTTARPEEIISIQGSKLHLVESIYFQNNVKATQYGSRSENLIEVYVPANAAKGSVKLKLVTFDGKEVESPAFTISGVDPVVDPSYVFFDFDSKGKWWGTYGSIENNASLSINGNYYRINENLPSGWVDFFWRNSKDNFKTDGVTVADWAIKMDVNVLGGTTQEFKFRLNGSDGDFWAIIPRLENKGGWYTVTIPLTNFRDADGTGSNRLPNVQNIDQDFGLATNGAAGFVNMSIDNIRFEKIR